MATNSEETYSIPRLQDYHISEKTGFMLEQPLLELPEYFKPWNDVGKHVAELINAHKLRDAVHKMELLDHNRLQGYRQWRLAHMFLSFIGHGYVWQEGDNDPPKSIPRQLAIPWYEVSRHLGVPAAASVSTSSLSNWRLLDPCGSLTIENMSLICEFPGGINCRWFFTVPGFIDMKCVAGIKAALKSKHCVLSADVDGVLQSLNELADNLKLLTSILTRMHECLDADVFYHQLRPFLCGWGGPSSVLPEGLFFEGVSDTPLSASGSTAAESSTMPSFDAALGIVHEEDKQEIKEKLIDYMPPAHAQFIRELRKPPHIRQFVCASGDGRVIEAYNNCVSALTGFRSYHLKLVFKYIVAKTAGLGLGTGGTDAVTFLRSVRDTTKSSSISAAVNNNNSTPKSHLPGVPKSSP